MRPVIFYLCLNVLGFAISVNQDTYRGAVVAYTPNLTAEEPLDRFYENVRAYLSFIDQAGAQKSDIIVFPEDGLTGWYDVITHTDIRDMVSTQVPNPELKLAPCTSKDKNYSKAFKDFSCSAIKNKMYVVVNLVEQFYVDYSREFIYFNTDAVFDRHGRVIARYRKINLLNEVLFRNGEDVVSFKTDFGVTFGIFTCFDISFKNPSLDVLADPEITDIVYPVAWFSHLPFLQGLSVHHGYVTSTGVNMLAAGYHNPETRNGGAAIYLASGKIAQVHISGQPGSKLLIHDVPKISAKKPPQTCQVLNQTSEADMEQLQNIASFETSSENLANYTFKALDLSKNVIQETVCSGGKFCCDFDIALEANAPSNYIYRLVAYHGTVQLSQLDVLGSRSCAVVACTDENTTSCGRRHQEPPSGVTFNKIRVKGVFVSKEAHDQPSTLKYNLKPVTNYTFCKHEVDNDRVEVSISTSEKQDMLLTFGIYGRVYSNDHEPLGVINITSVDV